MTLHALHTRLLPAMALVLALASPALAGWPGDSTVNVPVSRATSSQYFPDVASDGMGGILATWRDYNGSSARVQRVSADGRPLWTTNGVILSTSADMYNYASVCADGSGGAIVAWVDGVTWQAYAQRVSAAGTPLWTSGGVALSSGTGAWWPRVLPDGSGGVIVTWGISGDVYVQRVSAAGAVQWGSNGVALCTAANSQYNPRLATDGAGGAIVTWYDYRAATNLPHIYAQRISAAGAPQWTANGVAVCTADSGQVIPTIASDGAGGAVVAWLDYRFHWGRPFAQRLSSTGAPQWTANGVALATSDSCQIAVNVVSDGSGGAIVSWNKVHEQFLGTWYGTSAQRVDASGVVQWGANGVPLSTTAHEYADPSIVPDGLGGAIVAWEDYRNGGMDVYAQRVDAAGARQWGAGSAICTAASDQRYPALAADGAGGAIAVWIDWRNYATTYEDVYAQRVDRWGCLGAQPAIRRISDVPGDEGGMLFMTYARSPEDHAAHSYAEQYWFWRQIPPALAQAALARGATLASAGESGATDPRRMVRTTVATGQTYYWEYIGQAPSTGDSTYNVYMTTPYDSMPGYAPRTAFMVEARNTAGTMWWFSDPDSSCSIDNTAPPAPSPFSGQYLAGTTTLHWGVSAAPDFATFRLHRGTAAGFVPGPSNLVVAKADTGYVDVAGTPYFYKLAAVDLHGNVSPYAFLLPGGTVDVPGAELPKELALSPPAPNPFRGACTMRLALPRTARVSLAVFDQQGRRVSTLLAGVLPAGERQVTWDGADDGRRPVPSGIYFVRLECEGRAVTRRIAAIR